MDIASLEIIMVAIVVSVACVIPGVFLVLRGVALMSDAISHSILLGIVAMFFVIGELHSVILIFGASLAGLLSVVFTELLIRTKRLKEDAAIGFVFPVFFSIGVILVSRYASTIHLDIDAVLLGEIAYAPVNRLFMMNMDLGPVALWVMGGILLINLCCLLLFYKELKLVVFDPGLAHSLGLSPSLIYYGLMFITSITCVGAFDAVGSILVVALMITPAATAFLLTDRLKWMIVVSCCIGVLSSILGYLMAYLLDASIAGSMASATGIIFVLTLLFSPSQGLVMKMWVFRSQKLLFTNHILLVQLLSHEGTLSEPKENSIGNMIFHMGLSKRRVHRVVRYSVTRGYIYRNKTQLSLTSLGREMARSVMRGDYLPVI